MSLISLKLSLVSDGERDEKSFVKSAQMVKPGHTLHSRRVTGHSVLFHCTKISISSIFIRSFLILLSTLFSSYSISKLRRVPKSESRLQCPALVDGSGLGHRDQLDRTPGQAAHGRQFQPEGSDEARMLCRHRRQQVHLGLRLLGQLLQVREPSQSRNKKSSIGSLLQGVQRGICQNCANHLWSLRRRDVLGPVRVQHFVRLLHRLRLRGLHRPALALERPDPKHRGRGRPAHPEGRPHRARPARQLCGHFRRTWAGHFWISW